MRLLDISPEGVRLSERNTNELAFVHSLSPLGLRIRISSSLLSLLHRVSWISDCFYPQPGGKATHAHILSATLLLANDSERVSPLRAL